MHTHDDEKETKKKIGYGYNVQMGDGIMLVVTHITYVHVCTYIHSPYQSNINVLHNWKECLVVFSTSNIIIPT